MCCYCKMNNFGMKRYGMALEEVVLQYNGKLYYDNEVDEVCVCYSSFTWIV